jgi:DNA-binding HxlR family transcriptional regulator
MSFATATTAVSSKVEKRKGCIQAALNILGDKWSPLLLGQLIAGAKTFGELEVALGGIRVKQMYCKHPPRYRYELTNKGRELQNILRAMGDWGDKYHNA